MALPSSGEIRLSQIKTELGSTSNSLVSLKSEAGLTGTNMSMFYGYSAVVSVPEISLNSGTKLDRKEGFYMYVRIIVDVPNYADYTSYWTILTKYDIETSSSYTNYNKTHSENTTRLEIVKRFTRDSYYEKYTTYVDIELIPRADFYTVNPSAYKTRVTIPAY
jgi:hypothetical protein